jgi:hypothetical protein
LDVRRLGTYVHTFQGWRTHGLPAGDTSASNAVTGNELYWLQRFVVKSIALAIARDGASGGVVRTVTVSSLSLSLFLYIIENEQAVSWPCGLDIKMKAFIFLCIILAFFLREGFLLQALGWILL